MLRKYHILSEISVTKYSGRKLIGKLEIQFLIQMRFPVRIELEEVLKRWMINIRLRTLKSGKLGLGQTFQQTMRNKVGIEEGAKQNEGRGQNSPKNQVKSCPLSDADEDQKVIFR